MTDDSGVAWPHDDRSGGCRTKRGKPVLLCQTMRGIVSVADDGSVWYFEDPYLTDAASRTNWNWVRLPDLPNGGAA